MKLDERVRERLAALIKKGEAVRATSRPPPPGYILHPNFVDGPQYSEWRTQVLACLTDVFRSGHVYTASFQSGVKGERYTPFVDAGLGILRAALDDVEQGYIQTLREMAAAEVFSDFLDQADHLLENGYVAPAASLAGAILESGLGSLAERNDIPVKPRDDLSALNNKLRDKNVYNRLRYSEVSVWIELRNRAVHKDFKDLPESKVADMIRGVRSFLAEEA